MPALVGPASAPNVLSCRDQPVLPGPGIVVRPWIERDADAVVEAYTDPDVQRWNMRSMDDADEALAWIKSWRTRWSVDSDAGWAITLPDGTVAGAVSLRGVHAPSSSGQISYWVLPGMRGRGLAARGVELVTAWALDVAGLQRLWLTHSVHNRASCAVAERAQFEHEGTLRRYMLHADGWHDVHLHARIA
ncbi:GNAT family N-acetyltransferase [Rhodococcoides yunnanense]|uniref:GNAT family N-acetyltransferase n=1 Tax=Rhodococcoides yunnanense TaxID=278209 RepID=UPI000933D1C1|nr:GNAT family N-acetyltransferase [Rhodococcus yunnanensis]